MKAPLLLNIAITHDGQSDGEVLGPLSDLLAAVLALFLQLLDGGDGHAE
jgi:hypothetical protein